MSKDRVTRILKVAVWDLISSVYNEIGIPIPTTNELMSMVDGDKATWDVFAKGICAGVNQCEKDATKQRLMRYKPQNVSELSAFVAAIRPGFKSNLEQFLSRQHFDYGIPVFDELIQTKWMPNSYLLYQENIMTALAFAGFPATECYAVLKHISKKHPDKIAEIKPRFISGFVEGLGGGEEAQANAEKIWQIISDASSYSFNACLPGDEVIFYHDNGRHKRLNIEEMYKTLNDKEWAEKNGHKDLHSKYRAYGYGTALSMYDDGRIRENTIVDIVYSGEAELFKITLEDGRSVRATCNHRFPTANGIKRVDELSAGDELYIMGEYEKCKNRYKLSRPGENRINTPKKGQHGFQKLDENRMQKFLAVRSERLEQKTPCSMCGEWNENLRYELHHIDCDRANNDSENLMWLCAGCHKKMHYSLGRVKRYQKGIPTETRRIVSIEPDGFEPVYDVEMADPAHTFVTRDGIVTHNSHSTAVAFDALYIAWAKAHYPLQTYRAMLEIYSKKGDKARLNLIKGEMFSGSGVMLEQCRFGRDNTDYGIDEENGVIRDCLISIPYINKTVSRELLSAYRNFDSWVECLVALDNTSLNKRQMETLIRLNYFREFGTINRLLNIYEEFKTGKCKYQSSYSDKTKETRLALLTEFERTTENEPEEQNVYTLAQNQARLLGTVLGTYDVNSRYYIVTDIDPTYSPKLTLYSLARGSSGVMKMKKDAFELSNIAVGDVIDTGDREKGDWQIRPKYRYNGNGSKPVEIPNTKELWLINPKIIRKAPTAKEENE